MEEETELPEESAIEKLKTSGEKQIIVFRESESISRIANLLQKVFDAREVIKLDHGQQLLNALHNDDLITTNEIDGPSLQDVVRENQKPTRRPPPVKRGKEIIYRQFSRRK